MPRACANHVLLGIMAALLLGCSGHYPISRGVLAITERDALAFIAKMTAASKSTPWVCSAGDRLLSTGPISGLSLNDTTLAFNVRYTYASIPVTNVNTVTGEVSSETNQTVRDESYKFDLRNLDSIHVYKSTTGCGGIIRNRWFALSDGSGLVLIAAPPAQLFEQTIAALKVLNPDRKIKTGFGF